MCKTQLYFEEEVRPAPKRAEMEISVNGSLDGSLTSVCLDTLTDPERNTLENELTLAAQVQRAFLPNQRYARMGWEAAYHYEPAGLLSGDYCDLVETKTGFLFLLGDVSGKGVAASLRMSQLHAAFRSLAEADPPLDVMVEAVNRMFCRRTITGQLATVVVGRAERDGAVEFVSAGHLPFLHLSDGRVSEKRATAIPLGVFRGTRFPVRRFSVSSGNSLLFFTDGLTESPNSEGKEYGIERLKALTKGRLLPEPSELISECLSDHLSFTDSARPTDDLSLLVIRRAV